MYTLLAATSSIHWVDYLIVVASILLAVVMGFYFAHRQKDSNAYFTASGRVPDWAIGISIFATLISSVTFQAQHTPATGFCSCRDSWCLSCSFR